MSNYGCNNKPLQSPDATYTAQAGWHHFRDPLGNVARTPKHVEIKAAFGTTTCQYDAKATDKDCVGCWQADPAKAGMQSVIQGKEAA